MRRLGGFFFAVVLVLVAVLSQAVPAYASAQRDRLSAQVQVSKSSLPGPGTVDLKLTITNKGNPVTNVTITYPETGQKVTLGNMGTDQTEVHENPRWEITQSMLDTPLTFEVSWTSQDGSERSGTTPAVTIAEASASVNVKAEAVVDKTHVEEGDKVTFTFTFENTGNVDVKDAYLVAPPLNGGNRLGDDFSLDPGQSNTKTWSPTVNEEITVKPEYTYTVDGEEHTLTCEPITVRIGNEEDAPVAAAFSMMASANQSTVGPGGEVEFTIAVQNVGGAEISNVRVMCSNGTAAKLAQDSLQPGASTTATQKIRVDRTQSYTYTVTGTSEGEPLSAESDPIEITVDPNMAVESPGASLDASNIIEIDVSVVTQVSKPGPVPVEVTVRNLSDEDLMNIVVSAENVGASLPAGAGAQALSLLETTASAATEIATPSAGVTIGTIQKLAAGDNEVLNGTLDIQRTADYVFRVSAEMEDGTLVTSETSRATITLDQSPMANLENWQWIAIILAAVIAAVIIILVVYMRRRKKNARTAQAQAQEAPQHTGPPPQRPKSPRPPAGASSPPPRKADSGAPARVTQNTAQRTKAAQGTAASKSNTAPRKPVKNRGTGPQQYGDRNNF